MHRYRRIQHLKRELMRLPVRITGSLVETTDSEYVKEYACGILRELRRLRCEVKKREPPFLAGFSEEWKSKLEKIIVPHKVGDAKAYNVFPTSMGIVKISNSWRKLYYANKIRLNKDFVLEAEEVGQHELVSHYKVLIARNGSLFHFSRHLFFWEHIYVLDTSVTAGLNKCVREMTRELLPTI